MQDADLQSFVDGKGEGQGEMSGKMDMTLMASRTTTFSRRV
jgi:hypothetical protein